MAIISAFDSTYTAYNAYQSSMERYWTLKYIEQENIHELTVNVFKTYPGTPALARAETLPLVLSINGAPELQRGAQIRVRLSGVDLMSLDIKADFLELCQTSSNTTLESTQIPEFEEDFEDSESQQIPQPIGLDLDLDLETELEMKTVLEDNNQTTSVDTQKGNPSGDEASKDPLKISSAPTINSPHDPQA
jgi:exoribonuclease-2